MRLLLFVAVAFMLASPVAAQLAAPNSAGVTFAHVPINVSDGACMTSSANQNPSITYMALTLRAVNQAVDLMDRGEL